MDASEALRLQAAVGYGLEDTQMVIESMAQVSIVLHWLWLLLSGWVSGWCMAWRILRW